MGLVMHENRSMVFQGRCSIFENKGRLCSIVRCGVRSPRVSCLRSLCKCELVRSCPGRASDKPALKRSARWVVDAAKNRKATQRQAPPQVINAPHPQFLQSKNLLNSAHPLNLSNVSTSYCNVTSVPLPSLCLGGQMKQRPSGLPSGLPIEHLNAWLQPSAGPKSMWLNLEALRHTISMSGPGQRSTFQVREVALSIWLSRPTRRRTAVESTAAIAWPTRAAAVAREGDSGVLLWGGGVVRRHVSSELAERGFAVDADKGASQNARVGMRAT
jgi:hypothetical protein